MNWYRKIARLMDQQSLQEIQNLTENHIWLPISQKSKAMSQDFANYALNREFMNLGNMARAIYTNIENDKFQYAQQLCQQLKQRLTSAAKYLDIMKINQALDAIGVYVADMLTRQQQDQWAQQGEEMNRPSSNHQRAAV